MKSRLWRAIVAATLGFYSGTSRADVIGGPILNPANGHAYYLLAGATWTASEAEAVSLGGHLAAIADAEEEGWVYETFKNHGGSAHYLWIGLTDAASQGSFGWTTGESLAYTNWAGGEPTNGAPEDYVYITAPVEPPDRAGFWNDIDDSQPLNGVVEVESLPTTTTTTTAVASTSGMSTSSVPVSLPTSTTTSSTLAGCVGIAASPTFASIVCRLESLVARVNDAPSLGLFQAKLVSTLATGRERAVEARDECGASEAKKAKARLKQVGRAVIQYRHRLSGLSARKKLDQAVRLAFLEPADALRRDVKTLRSQVACPGDAINR